MRSVEMAQGMWCEEEDEFDEDIDLTLPESLLREYISLLLIEAAVPLAQIVSEGLALIKFEEGENTSLVLYDPRMFEKMIAQWTESRSELGAPRITVEDVLLGYIDYGPSRVKGQTYGAKEVRFSGARSGYGPRMYDIAMADAGILMSDRKSVSDAASGVWKKYLSDRHDDIEPIKLDVQTPKGGTEIRRRTELEYGYALKGRAPNVDGLIRRNQSVLTRLSMKYDVKVSELKRKLEDLSGHFFEVKYFGTPIIFADDDFVSL